MPPVVAAPLDPPDWVENALAVAEWRRIAPELQRLGILAQIDTTALATYCETWARWREAEAQIRKFGMVIKGKGGQPVLSPYVSIATRAMRDMRAWLTEFGATPSARTRVHAEQKPAADDPFAEFLDASAPALEPWRG